MIDISHNINLKVTSDTGSLAQTEEHLPCEHVVLSSKLTPPKEKSLQCLKITIDPWYSQVYGSKEIAIEEKP